VSCPAGVTEPSKLSDLLAAASLLLTALGVVYGTWYPEIVSAIGEVIPEHRANRGQVRIKVNSVFLGKALPLAITAVILTILFLPDAVAIAASGFSELSKFGTETVRQYNAVEAAFLVVDVLTGALACYLLCLAFKLREKLRAIDGP